jgi:hypothetical protein
VGGDNVRRLQAASSEIIFHTDPCFDIPLRIKICEFVSPVLKANGLSYRSLGHRPDLCTQSPQ